MRRFKRSDLNSPKYWRNLAGSAKENAAQAEDHKVRGMMLGFAEGFERMATRIEKISERAEAGHK